MLSPLRPPRHTVAAAGEDEPIFGARQMEPPWHAGSSGQPGQDGQRRGGDRRVDTEVRPDLHPQVATQRVLIREIDPIQSSTALSGKVERFRIRVVADHSLAIVKIIAQQPICPFRRGRPMPLPRPQQHHQIDRSGRSAMHGGSEQVRQPGREPHIDDHRGRRREPFQRGDIFRRGCDVYEWDSMCACDFGEPRILGTGRIDHHIDTRQSGAIGAQIRFGRVHRPVRAGRVASGRDRVHSPRAQFGHQMDTDSAVPTQYQHVSHNHHHMLRKHRQLATTVGPRSADFLWWATISLSRNTSRGSGKTCRIAKTATRVI